MRRRKRGSPSEGRKYMIVDEYTQIIFFATKYDILAAENKINRLLGDRGDVSLNDLYDALGLPDTPLGDLVGWSWEAGAEWAYSWIHLDLHKRSQDGKPYYILRYRDSPTYDYLGLDDYNPSLV